MFIIAINGDLGPRGMSYHPTTMEVTESQWKDMVHYERLTDEILKLIWNPMSERAYLKRLGELQKEIAARLMEDPQFSKWTLRTGWVPV